MTNWGDFVKNSPAKRLFRLRRRVVFFAYRRRRFAALRLAGFFATFRFAVFRRFAAMTLTLKNLINDDHVFSLVQKKNL